MNDVACEFARPVTTSSSNERERPQEVWYRMLQFRGDKKNRQVMSFQTFQYSLIASAIALTWFVVLSI